MSNAYVIDLDVIVDVLETKKLNHIRFDTECSQRRWRAHEIIFRCDVLQSMRIYVRPSSLSDSTLYIYVDANAKRFKGWLDMKYGSRQYQRHKLNLSQEQIVEAIVEIDEALTWIYGNKKGR